MSAEPPVPSPPDPAPLGEDSDVTFPRLDGAQLATMEAAGRRERLDQGRVLYSPGDLDYEMLVVLSGCVEILDGGGTDHERVLVRYGARQFAGELNLITLEPALLKAVVAEAGEGIFVSREALREVVSRDTRLGDLIMNALVSRRATIIEAESGARLIGYGTDPGTRQLREFLTRNRVPHRFIDLDGADGIVAPTGGEPPAAEELPMLVSGEKALRAPTILVDAVALGGQASTSSRIENYLGFPAGVSGSDLADRAIAQARRFGLRTAVPERAESLRLEDGRYVVELDSGDELAARTVVLATGASYRRLPVAGIERLNGSGVFYAATLVESRMCGSTGVAVVGGGNSAGQAAIFLSGTVERVHLLLRGGDLGRGMSSYLVDQIEAIDNIEVLLHHEMREVAGETVLEGIVVEDNRDGGRRDLPVGGLFVFIGADPCTEWLDGALAKDDDGFLLTGVDLEVTHLGGTAGAIGRPALPLETSLPGVFTVGDGRSGSIKRVASAVGEGSMAVRVIHEYLALQG